MNALLLGLMAGGALFLALGPGAPPWRPTPLARLYAGLGAAPPGVKPGAGAVPWVRRLPLQPLVGMLKPLTGPAYRLRMERLLRISRLSETYTCDDLLAMKVAAALGAWLYVALIMLKKPDPLLGLFLGSLGVLGFFLPDAWVSSRARSRQEQIRRELPGLLSALAVALESGLGLMGAIGEVARNRGGVLAGELKQAVDLYERGMTAGEALESMVAELEVTEVTVVFTGLLQAFAKGSGQVVKAVRSQAAEAWQKRKRRADSLAQTASVKLFLPLALLALPGFMIFLLGPAVLEVLAYFNR